MLLIHGFAGTPATWSLLAPALERHHHVLAATLLGHRGGPEYLAGSSATPMAIADALERDMTAAGFERLTSSATRWVAGSRFSLPAWPGALDDRAGTRGGWNQEGAEARRLVRMFRQNDLFTRLLGAEAVALMRRRRFRALALRYVVAHPGDVPAALAVEMARAAVDCAISLPLLEHLAMTGFGELAAIDSPVQIVWGTKDRILRWPGYAERSRRMVPGARWVELRRPRPLPDARRRAAHRADDPRAHPRSRCRLRHPADSADLAGFAGWRCRGTAARGGLGQATVQPFAQLVGLMAASVRTALAGHDDAGCRDPCGCRLDRSSSTVGRTESA